MQRDINKIQSQFPLSEISTKGNAQQQLATLLK